MPDADELQRMQVELQQYHKALQEEFAASEATSASANVEKYTRDYFKRNVADAAAQVVWLSHNADSDSIRLRACQIIINEALADARADGDPIKDLMRELTTIPSTTNSPGN